MQYAVGAHTDAQVTGYILGAEAMILQATASACALKTAANKTCSYSRMSALL
jgi:hypothetical protein